MTDLTAKVQAAIEVIPWCSYVDASGTAHLDIPNYSAMAAAAVRVCVDVCVAAADEWLLVAEDVKSDNANPTQAGDGTTHNKACRYIGDSIRALAPPEDHGHATE